MGSRAPVQAVGVERDQRRLGCREESPGFRSEEKADRARRAAPFPKALRFPVETGSTHNCALLSGRSARIFRFCWTTPRGPAEPSQLVEILNQRMNGRGMAERVLSQTGKHLQLVLPCGEVERGVESAPQLRKWILIAIDRFACAGGVAGGNVVRLGDGRHSGSPCRQGLQRQAAQTARRSMHENSLPFCVLAS